MIDIHSHILYGIDDGSKTLEESIAILKKASENNVTDIILTPHYIKDSRYNVDNKEKQKLLEELQKEVKRNNLNINLYLGNEVYIDEDLIPLLKKDIATLNNGKYILIELPLSKKYDILEEVIKELIAIDLTPIIAHPERYLTYYKEYEFFKSLINMGCLFQSNIGSLYGQYGRKSKKMIKQLLKKNMIHFISSDIHHTHSDVYEKNIHNDLLKIVKNEQIVEDLLTNNAKKVINNEEIYIDRSNNYEWK